MIIECIIDCTVKGKRYKVGDQKNVIDSFGVFLIGTEKWKYVKGATDTKVDAQFYADYQAKEEE